jgi:hypothetical protein
MSVIYIDRRKSKQICISHLTDKNKQTNKQRLETGTAPSNADNNSEKNMLPYTKDLKLKKGNN